MIKNFLLQLQFLTRIPVPFNVEFDRDSFARGIVFAPLIGAIIGLILGGVFLAINVADRVLLSVLGVIIAEIFITGGLHLDGLADTSDGFFSNRPREEILKIMSDSRIGTNGTLALILILGCKVALLVNIDAGNLLPCIIGMPVLSRMNIIWSAGMSGYAKKEEGLGKSIAEKIGPKEIVVSTFIALVICVPLLKTASLALAAGLIIFCILFTHYTRKRIGGVTGDTFGALIEISEIGYLFLYFVLQNIINRFFAEFKIILM